MGRKWAAGFAACALLLCASNVWADGVMLDGVSPRSVARGGTNLGFADNGGVIYDNPGAMVNVAGDGLVDIGGEGLFVSGHYAEPPGTNVYSTTFTPLPQIGIIKKSCDGCWAVGFGIFTPAGFSERFNMDGPAPIVGNRRYETFGALVKIPVGIACRVTDQLSIGGTIGLGVSYADLEGPYFLNGPNPLAGLATDLRTHGLGADFIWSVGMQYCVSDDTTIGASYLSASPFVLNGDSSVTVPGLGTTRYDSALSVEWPESVGIGIRHALCPHRTISADVVWFDWSHSFDHFSLELNDPSNPAFQARAPQLTDHFPLDWRDSVSFRFGYEQQLNDCVTMRAGYVYHRDPIPDETLTPFIQAFLEHTLSVGFTWKWNGWDVDLGYIHMFGPRQHVGTSALAGGDFNNSTQDVAVDAILLGLMRPF
jgi:long-chain fatty acid transport protein